MFLHEAQYHFLSLFLTNTYRCRRTPRCYSPCPVHGIFLSEDGENREEQLTEWHLPEHDLIYPKTTCLQLLLSALDVTDKRQQAHMFLYKDIDRCTLTLASAKLSQSKWIKKGFSPRGSGSMFNLLREQAMWGMEGESEKDTVYIQTCIAHLLHDIVFISVVSKACLQDSMSSDFMSNFQLALRKMKSAGPLKVIRRPALTQQMYWVRLHSVLVQKSHYALHIM